MSAPAERRSTTSEAALRFARMDASTRPAAEALLGAFLDQDEHYRAAADAYGDGGRPALARALELFLAHPEIGFVWLGRTAAGEAVAACVACHAISTSRGALVAKLDDVTVAAGWQGRGVGSRLLDSLAEHLRARGFGRIDTACHRDNAGAWRFYARLGFQPLDEERLARLL